MFAILQITESERKFHNIFRKPQIESERITLPNGDAFFIVKLKNYRKNIPWKKLEKCMGILKHCVLLSDDTTIPDDVNITPFTSDTLQRIVLMNSATDYILNHKAQFISKSLAICDDKAIYTNYIEKLIYCFTNIKIITSLPEKYNLIQNKLLETYGISLIITSAENYDSDILISHKSTVPLYYSGRLFTNEKKYFMNAEVFSGSIIDLPKEYEKLRPENISSLLFASALYEKSGVKEIGELRYIDFDS